MQMPYGTEVRLHDELTRRIKDYSHKAEEFCHCYTSEDEKKTDVLLAQAEAIKELWLWMEANL